MEREQTKEKTPALVVEYTDPLEGFQGWLVIDSLDHALCAGGMRVQKGLTKERLALMASNMTCKMRICGLRVDGAKSGIDYDPAAPGKHGAMSRFMSAIAPYVRSCYSMGPDMNVDMAELDYLGSKIDIPSVKMAVAKAQGWDLVYFTERYRILKKEFEGWPLGRLRVGYGVGVAALAVLDYLGIAAGQATVAIQGFGALAKAATFALHRKGVKIIALADAEKCVVAEGDSVLDIKQLLTNAGTLLPEHGYGSGVRIAANEEIYRVPCDILIPGAMERTVTSEVAGILQVRAVVPGANLAVTEKAEDVLRQRNIPVIPDFLVGCGGSLSMSGLFGPPQHPEPAAVLEYVDQRMSELVRQILDRSIAENISPTQAAKKTCAEVVPQPGTRPYGDPNC